MNLLTSSISTSPRRKFYFATFLAAAVKLTFAADSTVTVRYAWEEFKRDHAKSYESAEEEEKRFGIFLKNLEVVKERNAAERAAGGSAVHGITKFSDLTQVRKGQGGVGECTIL